VGPKKSSASFAFHLWSWVAVLIFFYSIYQSIVGSWWWFIVGFVVMGVIWKANKKSNSENYLEAAMGDEEFYERVREFDGWIYQMEHSDAQNYLRQGGEHTSQQESPAIDSQQESSDPVSESEPNTKEASPKAYEIAADFGDLFEKHDGTSIYDVKELPHDKSVIRDALFEIYRSDKDQARRELMETSLLFLANYQNDIGDQPVKGLPDVSALSSDKGIEALADSVLDAYDEIDGDRYDELRTKAEEEYKDYKKQLGS
jgi:hypothetical protein